MTTKKNKFFAVSASAALVASAIVPVAASASEQFNDAANISAWATEAVSYFVEQNVIGGKPGNVFDPQGTVTRAEAAKMFATGLNLTAEGEVTFTDAKNHWAAKEIAAVAAEGIVGGFEDGTFQPDGKLTRAQAAKMMVEALDLTGEADLSKFTDVKAGQWYVPYIEIAVANGVLNGKSETTMSPDGNVSREEFATMLYRAFDAAGKIEKDPVENAELEAAVQAMEAAEKVVVEFELTEENVEELEAAVEALETAIAAVEAFEDADAELVAAAKEVVAEAKAEIEAVKVAAELAEAVEALTAAQEKVTAVTEVTKENVETLTADIAVLEAAIAAVEAFESETTTEAVAAAKAAVVAAKTAVAEYKAEALLTVEKVESTSENTIEVTFGKDEEVKSEDLTEKTLTLTAGDKVLTAKFVSLTGKVAIFEVVEGELVDTTEYTVTGTDVETKTFIAAFGEEVITGFEFVTSGLLANDPEAEFTEDAARSLTYKVLNQYGKEMDIADDVAFTAVVKKGAMPLKATATGNVLTINEKLVEGDVLTITVQSKDEDGKVVAEKTTEIKVAKFAETVATSVSKIEANTDEDEKTLEDLKAGDEFTLKATVLDQNNNTIPSPVRWMSSDASIVTFATTEDATFVDGATAEFVAKKEGTATITAFTPDGKASKTFEVTVGQGKLSVIETSATAEVVNKEAVTIYVNEIPKDVESEDLVSFKNVNGNKIPVKAADLKVEVTTDKDFAAADLTVEKVSDAAGNLTALKVTSNRTAQTNAEKAGNYATGLDYTIKLSTADEEVEAKEMTVTSKIDATVASIETATNVEYRAGNNPTEAITFKNAKGEVINVLASAVSFLNGETEVELQTTNSQGKFEAADPTDVVTGLKFNNAETEKVVIAVGTETVTVNVKVEDEAVLKTIALGSNVTAKGAVVSGEENHILPISLKDQDGNAFIPANFDNYVVKYNDSVADQADFTLAYFQTTEEGELITTDAENAEGVALVADTEGKLAGLLADKTFTGLQVVYTEGETTIKSNKISVVVGAIAQVTTATATVEATNLTLGATVDLTVVPVDQYGNVVVMTAEQANAAIQLTDSSEDAAINVADAEFTVVEEEGEVVGYKTTLTGAKIGAANIAAKVELDYNDVEEGGVKSATTKAIAMKVLEAADVISSLEIKEVPTVNNNATDNGDETTTSVQLEAVAGNVAIATKDVIWSVADIVDATGKAVEYTESTTVDSVKVYTFEDGEVTITEDGVLTATEGLTIKVTVKAESHNDTVATTTVSFDKTAAKFAEGLTATTVVEGETVEVDTTKALELTSEGIVLTFTGTDQYGEEGFVIPTNLATILVAHSSVATATAAEGGKVVIAPVEGAEEGAKTTVTVRYGGETLKFEVVIPTAAE